MPATRRSRTTGPVAKGAQSTLSFGNKSKVTKPTPATTKSNKKDLIAHVISDDSSQEQIQKSDVGHVSSEAVVKVQAATELAKPRTKEELEAEKVPVAQINRYWRARESERLAARVHQEDLSVEEKILRLFDMSSQYGPCIGIARMKRWVRANKLGLSPPIEVLAVLLKEEARGNNKIERAHVDELMSSKFVLGES